MINIFRKYNNYVVGFIVIRFIIVLIFLITASLTSGQPGKCDQTPPQATVLTPSENRGIYTMTIDMKSKNKNIYRADQTYVCKNINYL